MKLLELVRHLQAIYNECGDVEIMRPVASSNVDYDVPISDPKVTLKYEDSGEVYIKI